jgi:hypothetical protein
VRVPSEFLHYVDEPMTDRSFAALSPVPWQDVRVAESDVDSTPFHPEPGRARRQRRRVLRG